MRLASSVAIHHDN